MKKGFTLIELLAVIVILAIIALIATPIILNIIGNAKDESNERTKELYLDAVKDAIARKNLTEEFNPSECTIQEDGNLLCGDENLLVEVSGTKPCSGTITFDKKGKITNETVTYCDGNDVPQEDDDKEYVDSSGANEPDLMNDALTPVIYNTDHWEIADTTKEWYDYDNQEWANAVILSDAGKSKTAGQSLDITTDVKAMLVWIPRYEYKIDGTYGKNGTTATNPGEIEVKFIAKDTTVTTEGYTVHPAFNFGGTQLSGIWVGKFETSHTNGTKTLTCTDENCSDADNLRILPNVVSLRSNTVSQFFLVARSMERNGNAFGINSNTTDTHMMKNSEWGAVAYLSQSKYGKYGNSDYEDSNKEVYESISDYTGGSSGNPQSTNAVYRYDVENSGTGASTTGNIYGIYDMNGNNEYAMGFYLDDSSAMYYGSSSGFDKQFFEEANNLKYFDMYKVASTTSNSLEHKGRALDETLNWYNDYMDFVGSYFPWSTRGRDGIFGFYNEFGYNSTSVSSRVILSSKG